MNKKDKIAIEEDKEVLKNLIKVNEESLKKINRYIIKRNLEDFNNFLKCYLEELKEEIF